MGAFDEQIRQNMALFERAMKMFTPFAYRADESTPPAAAKPAEPARDDDTLTELKKQMAAMQAQLAALASKS